MNQYLITYNNTQGFDSSKIHQIISQIPLVLDWWHYLPNTYIVSTKSSAKQLADYLIPNFQGLLFFIVRLDLGDFNGVLNKDAWDWVAKKNNDNLKLKILPSLSPSVSPSLSRGLPPIFSPSPSPRPPKTLRELLDLADKIKK